MFSSFNIQKFFLVLICLMTSLLVGCDSKVGEEPPPPDSQEFGSTQCLSDIKPIMKNFIAGSAKNEELEVSWNCIASAIEKFKRYVRGRSADRYSSQELATFLENNFLDKDSVKISPKLQLEFMKVKQVFIGGNQDFLTRTEIDQLVTLIKNFKTITINLNPYVKILSLNWSISEANKHQSDVRFFEQANEEIQNTAKLLSSLIEKNGHSYKLSDFVSLMDELGGFLGEEWEFPKTISLYMPVIQKVKKALAGGDENSVAPNEWGRFTLLGSRGYIQFLRYYYFIKSVPETGTGYRLSYLSRTIEDVLSVFHDLVAEKPEGTVSRREVAELLKTLQVVWPEFKISDELVRQLMKIKFLFFGGSKDFFATSDFENARLKVSNIKLLIERFLPYYAIYGLEWMPELYDPEEAQKLFTEAQTVLESTGRESGKLFEGSYDLKDFQDLVAEVDALYPTDDESREEQVKRYLPLVIDLKNLFLEDRGSVLEKSNWSMLLSFAARFYTNFLYYNYFVSGNSFEQPTTIKHLSVLSNKTLDIFKDLISLKEKKAISRSEINKIARNLIQLEIIPKDVKKESLDVAIGFLLNNILVTPEKRIGGYVPNALTVSSISVLRHELQVWLETERFIGKISSGWKKNHGINPDSFKDLLSNTLKGEVSDYLAEGLNELLVSVVTPVPLTVDGKGHVNISNKIEHVYTAKSLRQLNINRAITRTLSNAIIEDKGRISSYAGANFKEVQSTFALLRPFLIDLNILERDNVSFADSRFREANIFTPHADGNSLVSFAEVSDLVGMILSGTHINTLLQRELVRVCFNGKDNLKNRDTVNLSCVRTAYKDAMPSAMEAMPEYLKFHKTASKDAWAYYMNNVFKAAGYIPNDKNLAYIEDISLTPHVIQYIEMLYARFDKNKDGFLSAAEAVKAYPSFKGMLKDLAADQIKEGKIKEEELLDVFTFILRYGRPPETIKDKAIFFFSWKGKPEKWDVWADRSQLAEILGYIADKVRTSKKAAAFNLALSEYQGEPLSR